MQKGGGVFANIAAWMGWESGMVTIGGVVETRGMGWFGDGTGDPSLTRNIPLERTKNDLIKKKTYLHTRLKHN